MKVGDWVIPNDKKTIVQIEEIETYDNYYLQIAYTSDRSAYPVDKLLTLDQVYALETLNQ